MLRAVGQMKKRTFYFRRRKNETTGEPQRVLSHCSHFDVSVAIGMTVRHGQCLCFDAHRHGLSGPVCEGKSSRNIAKPKAATTLSARTPTNLSIRSPTPTHSSCRAANDVLYNDDGMFGAFSASRVNLGGLLWCVYIVHGYVHLLISAQLSQEDALETFTDA